MYLGFEEYKNYLYGKIVIVKRDKPVIQLDLCKKRDYAWKSFSSWKTISLHKEFYEFSFHGTCFDSCILDYFSNIFTCLYLDYLRTLFQQL